MSRMFRLVALVVAIVAAPFYQVLLPSQVMAISTATAFYSPVSANAIQTTNYLEPWDIGALTLHPGIDLAVPASASNAEKAIKSIAAGQVKNVHTHSSSDFGNHVVIEHVLPDGDHIYSNYAHLDSIDSQIVEGVMVTAGQYIGIMGTSGRSTGVHLHFEIRAQDLTPDAWPPSVSGSITQQDVTNWIDAGDIPRYVNPTTFMDMYRMDHVRLFTDSYFHGGTIDIYNGTGLVNLRTSFNGLFHDTVSSIAIPPGWTVVVYENEDGSGGKKALEYTNVTFANDTFANSTVLLNDQISALEVYQNQCPIIALNKQEDMSGVAYAAPLKDSCMPPPSGPGPTPGPTASDGIELVSVPAITVGTGQQFSPSVTIKVTSGTLDPARGDHLHAVPEDQTNRWGAYPVQPVKHQVTAGQTYTFDSNNDPSFRMTAPNQPGVYYSTWRMRVGGNHIGPSAVIQINVQGDPNGVPPGTWRADYYNDMNFTAGPYFQSYQSGTYFFKDWGNGSPGGGVRVDQWSGRFSKSVYFPGGPYRFHIKHDDGATLFIDGQQVLRDDISNENDWYGNLTAGNHDLRVDLVENTGDAHLELWWQGNGYLPLDQICDPYQWCSQYWGNNHFAGIPAITRNEGSGELTRGWQSGNLGYDFPGDYFSARYTRTVSFNCATYRFDIGGDDNSWLYIDGVLKASGWTSVDIPMTAGNHVVRFDYAENTGNAFMHATWVEGTACPATATPTNTVAPTSTPTATPSLPNAVELLTSGGWHLTGVDGAAELYQSIPATILAGRSMMRITYNLHGLSILDNDASAIIFDQNGWKYISLSRYGQNGFNGNQTVDVPLSAFVGLNTEASVGTLHTRFWHTGSWTVDISSIVVYGSASSTPVSTATRTATSTMTPAATNTPTPTSVGGVQLLPAGGWHISGLNGAAELYQSIPSTVLAGKTMLRITYDLHGLMALGGDASAIIFDQNGWKYISLSNYGQNGKNGIQTVDIPLSAFTGLNTSASVGTLHTRFWYNGPFTVDIMSIVAY